jgi:aryl-alcohol dehydrogenase-like predicted oxidoreductase
MIERRNFLKLAGSTAAVAVAMARRAVGAAQSDSPGQIRRSKGLIARRTLGKTRERVSIVGIGGHHLGRALVEESESIRIVRTALDNGVNFLDNSWDYNDGKSEVRVGKALRDSYRGKAFLMTKIDGRDKLSAAKQIDDSLRRLQTDRIDLVQFHEVIRMNDPDRIFASGGAIEAMLEAKKAGKLRYIGFTGHKSPEIHLHMLQTADRYGFSFDTVQMPLNVNGRSFR